MTSGFLSAAIFLAGIGVCQAQTENCYPRIAAYSGQYEGQCPNSTLKWTVFENTIGAFGRNCSDEPWTYNRTEKSFYNGRSNEKIAMDDCYAPSREQVSDNLKTGIRSDAVMRFQEGRGGQSAASARPPVLIQR